MVYVYERKLDSHATTTRSFQQILSRFKICKSSHQLCVAWPQNEVKVQGLIDEGNAICVFTFLYFNPRTLNFERKYWEQLSCTINIFIKPRFYCCPALWVLHPLCQLLSKLSVNISHLSLLLSPLNLLSLLPLLFQIQIYLFCPTSLNFFCLIAKKNPTRNISSYV